ncbi:MAG: hypothetical protein AAGI52_13230 [Bacteroidota bacterium]
MTRSLVLFAALSTSLLFSGCSDPGADLVGTWRQASAREDGITLRYTFFADGRAQIVVRPEVGDAQTFAARYRVEDDSLLTLQDAQGEESFVARVTGDTLRLRNPLNGQRSMLYRVGG